MINQTLRIMLVGGGTQEAENIRQAVVSAGLKPELQIVHRREDFSAAIETTTPDIIVNRLNHDEVPLAFIAEAIKPFDPLPAIISIDVADEHSTAECMATGACDSVQTNQPAHLQAVIRRTALVQIGLRRCALLQAQYDELCIRSTTLLNTLEHPVAYLHEGIHISANPAYYQLFGLTTDTALQGTPLMDLVAPDTQKVLKAYLKEHKKHPGGMISLDTVFIINNEEIPVSLSSAEVKYEGENCTQLMIRQTQDGHADAITEQLNYLAIYDISSGLYTRNYLLEQVERILKLPVTAESGNGLILLSIDNYPALASALGHANTEQLYAEIGATLKGLIGLDDLLCRYDISTFGLLTTNLPGSEQDELVRELLSKINDHPLRLNGKAIPCRLSAGITLLDGYITDIFAVLSEAEQALVDAHSQGMDLAISTASKEGGNQLAVDATWADRLRRALTENYFKLVYQPVLSVKGDCVQRYSVSIRIDDPDEGYIAPARFLPSAERTGYAKGIDRWVIMNALEVSQYRQEPESESESEDPELLVKLTDDMLAHGDDLKWIGDHVRESDINPQRLIFQINAVSLIRNLNNVQQLIADLKPSGCKFAVSEFGNDLNPFQPLKYLDLDYLSLDPVLTRDIAYHEAHCELISQLCKQAHELGLEVMARKIMDGAQLFKIKDLGVDYIQGDILQQPSESLEYDFSLPA